jgi:hypothetical protein
MKILKNLESLTRKALKLEDCDDNRIEGGAFTA